jgi:hypothetical protein
MKPERPTEQEVRQAIEKILEDKKSYSTSLNYAVGYCRAAKNLSGYSLKVQVLYILNNITHWRHEDAKDVRKTLKAYSK